MTRHRRKRLELFPTGVGTAVQVRMHEPMLTALDIFIKEHDGGLLRPEAVRLILADALTSYGVLRPELPSPLNKRDAN